MPEEASSTFETITYQLAMAFGQGAGTMLASAGAVSTAIAPFSQAFSNNVNQWDDWALKSIEYARALGKLSSVYAAANGAAVIQTAHVSWALQQIANNAILPLGPCNCLEAGERLTKR
jgi:hypothetical protein